MHLKRWNTWSFSVHSAPKNAGIPGMFVHNAPIPKISVHDAPKNGGIAGIAVHNPLKAL